MEDINFIVTASERDIEHTIYHDGILKTINGGLTASIRECKRLASISAQNNKIIIFDIGCAIGGFVNSFDLINDIFLPKLQYVAIGVDPLIQKYKTEPWYSFLDREALNLYKNLYEIAISEKEGMVDFNVYDNCLDLSSLKDIDLDIVNTLPDTYESIKQGINDLSFHKVSCPSLTLNTLCQMENIDKIDILKLDTQGNEYEILNSINENLLKNIAIIYIETSIPNKQCLYKNQESFKKIYELLLMNNFTFNGAYGLDDDIKLEESIDVNCIFINNYIFDNSVSSNSLPSSMSTHTVWYH